MTRNGKIAAAVAGLALVVGAAGAVAHRHGHWGPGPHGGMHGFMGKGFMGKGGPLGAFCRGNAAEMADHMLVRVEHRVKPTDAQKPQFEALKTAIKSAATDAAAACPQPPATGADGKPVQKSAVDRLKDAETGLAAALDAVRKVQPAATAFYASLSDEQKKIADEMGPRGKGRHGKWWGGKPDDREKSGDRDADRDGPGREE
jgi:hypothetical protein